MFEEIPTNGVVPSAVPALPSPKLGRPRLFASDAERQHAYRLRQMKAQVLAAVLVNPVLLEEVREGGMRFTIGPLGSPIELVFDGEDCQQINAAILKHAITMHMKAADDDRLDGVEYGSGAGRVTTGGFDSSHIDMVDGAREAKEILGGRAVGKNPDEIRHNPSETRFTFINRHRFSRTWRPLKNAESVRRMFCVIHSNAAPYLLPPDAAFPDGRPGGVPVVKAGRSWTFVLACGCSSRGLSLHSKKADAVWNQGYGPGTMEDFYRWLGLTAHSYPNP